MRLGIILQEQEAILFADVADTLRIGAATIEMHNHHGTGLWRDGLFYQCVVNLQRVDVRLHEDRCEAVLRDGENGSNIRVGRHDDLVAIVQPPHLLIRPEDECQGIEPIGHTDAVTRTDILCIMLLEAARGLSAQIPSAAEHPVGSMLIGAVDGLKVQIFDSHSVHSSCHSVHSYQS